MEKGRIQQQDDKLRMEYFIHTLYVFEAEFLSYAKRWDQIAQLVEEFTKSGSLVIGTYEAVADILWAQKECPVNVLYGCLEVTSVLSF